MTSTPSSNPTSRGRGVVLAGVEATRGEPAMSASGRVGTTVCALALVMGASQAVHVYGWLQACWLVGAMAAVGSAVVVCAHSIRPLRPLTMVRATVAWSFVMLSLTGWLHAGARGAMVLVVLLVLVAFASVGAFLSRRRTRTAACASSARPSACSFATVAWPAVPSSGEASAVLSVPDELQVDDLCRAWRSSYLGLQAAGSVDSLLRAVHVRRLVLDELERRDPAAFEAWLRSGPRAAGDPGRHFRRPPVLEG